MPLPAQARECDFCEAAVGLCEEVWADAFATPPAVEWDFIDDVDLDRAAGLKVWLYPAGGTQVANLDRKQDLYEFKVGVIVCEKYDATGRPPRAWMAERTAFVEALRNRLGDQRAAPILGESWPETVEVVAPYEPSILREKRAFYSEFTVAWREAA